MLNTSLHNKNARLGGPLTYEKFVQSLNDAISRHEMPESSIIKVRTRRSSPVARRSTVCSTYLKNLYDNIKNNELKLPDDTVGNAPPVFSIDSIVIKEGWLWKQGLVRNWQRRWFVITDGCLFYFESRTVRVRTVFDVDVFARVQGGRQSSRHHPIDRCWRARDRRRSNETVLFRVVSARRRESQDEQADAGRNRQTHRRFARHARRRHANEPVLDRSRPSHGVPHVGSVR
jgi:hypothetical protein